VTQYAVFYSGHDALLRAKVKLVGTTRDLKGLKVETYLTTLYTQWEVEHLPPIHTPQPETFQVRGLEFT
jgi:hypothetical protein